jgi:hypothetical protein
LHEKIRSDKPLGSESDNVEVSRLSCTALMVGLGACKVADAHADADEGLEGGLAVDDEVFIPLHLALLEKHDNR